MKWMDDRTDEHMGGFLFTALAFAKAKSNFRQGIDLKGGHVFRLRLSQDDCDC